MEKWKVLWREQKWALLLLAAVNVWSILLFFWARQIDASPSYGLAAGTPARLVVDLILINAAGGALIAAGRYRRAQYAKNNSETDIYTGDDLVLHVTGLISDTLPRYVQPGMPDYLPNMIGASYERGNLEQLAVVFENRLGAAVETDDSYMLERKLSGKWYAVEEYPGYEPCWSSIVLPAGTSEKLLLPAWGRYNTLEHGYYRIVKTLSAGGKTYHLAGEFLLS